MPSDSHLISKSHLNRAYERIELNSSLLILPGICCCCITPTEGRWRFQSGYSWINTIQSAAFSSSDAMTPRLILEFPLCPACLKSYRSRKHWRGWIGHAEIILTAAVIVGLIIWKGRLEIYGQYVTQAGTLLVAFVLLMLSNWHHLNRAAVKRWIKPPVILSVRPLRQTFVVRFWNADFISPFLRAQQVKPLQLLDKSKLGPEPRTILPTGPRIWYCQEQGQRIGPFSFTQLKDMIAGGILRETDWVSTHSVQDWVAAGSVPGLFKGIAK